jgi:hypothetical protein
MNAENSPTRRNAAVTPADFSLVLGGPLYQLFRRARLADDSGTLELLKRRIIVIALFAWLPLLVLSLVEGRAWDGVAMPFLHDVDVHARFLIALPLLVLAELVVHWRMRPVIGQFVERGLITETTRGRFEAALASAQRLRNSVAAEVSLLAFVYGIGVAVVWRTHTAVMVTSWYGVVSAGSPHPSLAGWWFGCVSLPLFQFILLRWYFRLFIWARFLWHVSRIDLKLVPTHPDRCGGLSFLADVCTAFAPLLLAQGVMLSGTLANQIFFVGAKLPQFKLEIIGMVAAAVFAVQGPLLVFIPVLASLRRNGLREYGALAQCHLRDLDQAWVHGGPPSNVSLVTLNLAFDIVKGMRATPFTKQALLQLVVLTLAPLVPLLLTMVSFEEFLDRLLKVVF